MHNVSHGRARLAVWYQACCKMNGKGIQARRGDIIMVTEECFVAGLSLKGKCFIVKERCDGWLFLDCETTYA